MLEIKNLTKIYKSKGGIKVKALDSVSLKFPETGMIFLLGKSGSGKSTLLNICGGLDTPTSGEILVKGRSSKNFKQIDFDSYRNTFVGFIFQEYNILEEFTVEENIALALELQGKNKNLEAIDSLLEKVDLKGYNNRKPNTLSGGQKQRLAIARALVKSPEIIMADEPTGALDSTTGKQVFDTLKELSKDTLILVVSHDRDFAEKYADRIIELKDGKIISDVTRNKTNKFDNTNIEKIILKKYSNKDSEFITSKFPLRHAVRMGLSSLKIKKFRLVMTTFLCTIAFMMFGLLSTLMFYNEEATFKDTLKSSKLPFIQLIKSYDIKQTSYLNGEINYSDRSYEFGHFTTDEVNKNIKKYGNDTFGAIMAETSFLVQDTSIPYWVNSIYTFAYLDTDNTYRSNMIGEYPKEDDEIAISSYGADVIINAKIDDYDTGKTLVVNERKDLIGKKVKLKDTVYTITGIIDSGKISSEYETLNRPGKVDDKIFSSFMKELQDGLHLIVFVTENKLSSEAMTYSWTFDNFSERMVSVALLNDDKYNFDSASIGYYASFLKVGKNFDYLKLYDYTSLGDSEVLISYDYFAELVSNMNLNDSDISELAYSIYVGGENIDNKDGEYTFKKFSYEELVKKANELFELCKKKELDIEFGLKTYDASQGNSVGQTYEFTVAGIFIPSGYSDNLIIVNDSVYKKLLNYELTNLENTLVIDTNYVDRGYYDVIYVSYDKSEKATDMFWSIRSNQKLDKYDSILKLTGSTISELDTVNDIVYSFSQVFFWVGLVLAIFAALLFSNFISVSISNKRKEIGILRAIGAKGKDVFKIFFSESFILSMICVILSSIGTIVVSVMFNKILDLGVTIFVFGVMSFITIIIIAFITSFVATLIPVSIASRKKPIDSIRTI